MGHACGLWGFPALGEGQCHPVLGVLRVQIGALVKDWVGVGAAVMLHPAVAWKERH